MEKFKQCKQCGQLKGEEEFRKYYGGRKGRYKTCFSCEKVNTKYKYLSGRMLDERITPDQQKELDMIEELYILQRKLGLRPPSSASESTAIDLHAMIEEMQRVKVPVTPDTPKELLDWLNADLSDYDPDELDLIGDELMAHYQPQVGVDEKLNPVYDYTYRDTLQTILKRFDDHSDNFEY